VRTSACDLLDELGRQVGLLDLGRRELLVREDGRVWVQARAAFAVVCIAPGPQRSGGGRVRCACTEQSPLPCPPPPLRHPAARCRAHATQAHCFTSCSARTRVLSSWSEKKKTTSILRFPRAQQVPIAMLDICCRGKGESPCAVSGAAACVHGRRARVCSSARQSRRHAQSARVVRRRGRHRRRARCLRSARATQAFPDEMAGRRHWCPGRRAVETVATEEGSGDRAATVPRQPWPRRRRPALQ